MKNTTTDLETLKIEPAKIDLSMIPEEYRQRFFNPGELEILIQLLRMHNIQSMVEFGCQNGRTAKAILNNVPGIDDYIGVDVPPDTILNGIQKNEVPPQAGQLALDDDRFHLILSKNGSRDLIDVLHDHDFDAIFIDGDHSKKGVLHDHDMALYLVSDGGIIIHHDYHDLGTVGVKDAITELSQKHKFYYIENTWFVIQKI